MYTCTNSTMFCKWLSHQVLPPILYQRTVDTAYACGLPKTQLADLSPSSIKHHKRSIPQTASQLLHLMNIHLWCIMSSSSQMYTDLATTREPSPVPITWMLLEVCIILNIWLSLPIKIGLGCIYLQLHQYINAPHESVCLHECAKIKVQISNFVAVLSWS